MTAQDRPGGGLLQEFAVLWRKRHWRHIMSASGSIWSWFAEAFAFCVVVPVMHVHGNGIDILGAPRVEYDAHLKAEFRPMTLCPLKNVVVVEPAPNVEELDSFADRNDIINRDWVGTAVELRMGAYGVSAQPDDRTSPRDIRKIVFGRQLGIPDDGASEGYHPSGGGTPTVLNYRKDLPKFNVIDIRLRRCGDTTKPFDENEGFVRGGMLCAAVFETTPHVSQLHVKGPELENGGSQQASRDPNQITSVVSDSSGIHHQLFFLPRFFVPYGILVFGILIGGLGGGELFYREKFAASFVVTASGCCCWFAAWYSYWWLIANGY